MNLYTDNPQLYGVTIASDGNQVSYTDPTEGPQQIPSIVGNAGEFLQVNATADNIQWTSFGATGGIDIAQINLADGTEAAPSLTFQSDTSKDAGMYREAENTVSFSTGGVRRLQITNDNVTVGKTDDNTDLIVRGNILTAGIGVNDGTAAAPSITFSDDTNTGIYSSENDAVNISAGGVQRLKVSGTEVEVGTTVNPIDLRVRGGLNVAGNCQLGDASGDTITSAGLLRLPDTILDAAGTYHIQFGTSGNGMSRQTTGWSAIQAGLPVMNFSQTPTTTCFSPFTIGTVNATNSTRSLTVHGPATFNTFTPNYSTIFSTVTTTGRTDANWIGIDCDQARGVYIIGSNGSLATNPRIAVSAPGSLTSWTVYTDTVFALGNMSNVAYSASLDMWVIGSKGNTTQNFYSSPGSDLVSWTRVQLTAPFNTARAYQRLRFINGQFIALSTGSFIAFSNNGTTWTGITANATAYTLNEIAYSPELRMYVISTASNAFLYYSDPTNAGITAGTTFTAVTSGAWASINIGYSPKFGRFIAQRASVNSNWTTSTDGINWTQYNVSSINQAQESIDWIPDFGGFFCATQSATTNNCNISRDGITWTQAPLSISGNTRCLHYNTSTRTFVFGMDVNCVFKNASSEFAAYTDSDNIYNTFNSNTRFSDNLEYQPQALTAISGDNHYTTASFTRSVVSLNTASANANIYLQGSSFAGRVGTRFVIRKFDSELNGVRVHGYDGCRLVAPTGVISNFSAQSSPVVYNLIPDGHFGSFVLERVSDSGTGVWMVSDVMLYDSAGTVRQPQNLSIGGNLTVDGTISSGVGNPRMSSIELRYTAVLDADINVPHFVGCYCDQLLGGGKITIYMKNLGANGVGTNFYVFRTTGSTNNVQITNDSGKDIFLTSWNTSTNNEIFTNVVPSASVDILAPFSSNSNYTWWKFVYMEINSEYRWYGKQIGTAWE